MQNDDDDQPSPQASNRCFGLTNKRWLRLKLLYVFKNGAMGAINPFIIAFYRSRGLSSRQIGLIECVVPFVSGLSRPLAAIVADRTGKHKLILFLSLVTFAALITPLIAIPPQNSDYISKNATNSTFDPENVTLETDGSIFWIIFVLRFLGAIPFAPTLSLADSMVYNALGGVENHKFWPQQRVFGTISAALLGAVLGWAVDFSGSYDVAFIVFAVFNVIASLITLGIKLTKIAKKTPENPEETTLKKTLARFMKNPKFLLVCLVAFFNGFLTGAFFVLLSQWMLHLGAEKYLLGLTGLIGRGVEIPGFLVAHYVVQKMGDFGCFLVMFLAIFVRFLVLSVLTPALTWLVPATEIFNLFTFVFFVTSVTKFAAAFGEPHANATLMAVIQSCHLSLGLGFGNLLSAEIYQQLGGRWTFLMYAALSLLLGTCLALYYVINFEKINLSDATRKEDRKLTVTNLIEDENKI